ncbi:MAG: cation diffusion facilitator family transporter [Firmicutes bacterium]|nr:cation diffusion facilitator family transporter [Bacillota bacterium]MDY6161527.1 cation diffusion facilitator family transporter [Candidatus Faecousia sp.]
MTNLLLRLFVPNASENTPAAHGAVGKLAGITGIVCNVLLASLKILAGLITGSVAITGDGINNLTDSASSIVTLLGFRIAQRPADGEHPFGHGRYEYISGVVVAALVLLAGAELAKSSVDKIIHPQAVPFTALTLVILLVSISVKLWMAGFNRKLSKLIGSKTLEATSQDSRNDVIATSAVLLSFLADGLFHIQLDGFVGLGVALFILWSGISLAKNTIDPLIGMQADEEMVEQLTEMILSHPRVLGIHDLLIHDYGPGHCFATVHAEMSAGESPLDAHDQLDHIEQEAMHNFGIHLVIHYDPIAETEDWAALRAMADTCAREVEPAASIHDLRIVDDQGQKKLTFDLAVPYSLPRTDNALAESVAAALKERGCPLPVVIHIDRQDG